MKRAMHTVSFNEWICKNASALKQKTEPLHGI